MKKRNIDLLNGPILKTLARLAGPIMAAGFIQMAYNLTDMLWLGRLSSAAVTAAGLAGMFLWLASGLSLMIRMGSQVQVGQNLGAGNFAQARHFVTAGFQLDLVFGLSFSLLAVLLAPNLIGFFNLHDAGTIANSISYLYITCGLCLFSFLNMLFTGTLNAMGDSKTPFKIGSIGLIVNIILDPLLIFGWRSIPAFGVIGAGWATIISQFLVTVLYIYACRDNEMFTRLALLKKQDRQVYRAIIRIGAPSGLSSMLFSIIAMVVSRQLSAFGDSAIAVQKVGVQVESISWMTADGFGSAVNAFVAQNYGAGKYDRVKKGIRGAMIITIIWGSFCVLLLTLGAEPIFRAFIQEEELVPLGASYLRILGYSELLNCVEITCAGAFNGLGHTMPPSVTEIVLSAIRIPLVALLSATALGLDGAWWSCSISCGLKGIVLLTWLMVSLPKMLKEKPEKAALTC